MHFSDGMKHAEWSGKLVEIFWERLALVQVSKYSVSKMEGVKHEFVAGIIQKERQPKAIILLN